MSLRFRIIFFLMITLTICWMINCGNAKNKSTCQPKACKGWSKDKNKGKYAPTKEFIEGSLSQCLKNCTNISCSSYEYKNCSECLSVCVACLTGGSNVSKNCQNLCLGSDVSDFCQNNMCLGVCSPCQLNYCTQILLFAGGFTGQIQSAGCDNSNDTTTCLDIYNGSTPFHGSTCILSFDTYEETATNETCRYSDSGVWLLNNTNHSSFQINITRDPAVRSTAPICYVKWKTHHYCNWTKHNATNCDQPMGNSSWNCGDVICVDPETICKKAIYSPNCSENRSNDDIITLSGSSAECYKCGNAFKQTDGQVKINFTLPDPQSDSNTSYHDVMKKLNEIILQEMGNKTSVSVSVDNIPGIFVKQEKEQDLSPIYFMYSFQTEFNIIEDETQLPTFNKTFSVPKEAFEKSSSLNASTLFASLFRFSRFKQDNKNSTLLNNEVYSIDMGEVIANLTNTFNLTFRNINPNNGVPLCSSWDGQGPAPNWTTDGCNTSYVDGAVTCSCQHLTFFAVLMSIPPKSISTSDLNNLTYITSIGCGLSLFFITIALFMHFLLRRGRASISVHILINLFLALFLLNLSFLSNESVANAGNVVGCKLMAGVMHYSMLSTFTWFGLQALHLCLQLTQNVATIQHYVTKLSIAGWVPPALVVTVIFINQKYDKQDIVSDTGKNASMCWINDPTVHYVVNIGYYCAIFLFTLLTFVVMLRWLWLLRRKQPTIVISGKKSRPSDALTIMGLCCILGLSWGFAFFAYGPLQIPALYIFTILNSFQGFFLFIYYYKSSKLVGEAETPPETSSLASNATVVENPYAKHKQF